MNRPDTTAFNGAFKNFIATQFPKDAIPLLANIADSGPSLEANHAQMILALWAERLNLDWHEPATWVFVGVMILRRIDEGME